MCRLPVTFGGGSRMQKGSAPGFAFAPARKASAASQAALIAGSAVLASKVFSIAVGAPAPRPGESLTALVDKEKARRRRDAFSPRAAARLTESRGIPSGAGF
jgi:hypothetical protein